VALKYAFDQFGSIIWGFPVEIETDCIALRDTLLNDKLSIVHARWRDGIIAYKIRSGANNTAADALSRRASGQPQKDGDSSAWSVSEDWETEHGLVNDLFLIQQTDSTSGMLATELCSRFKEEPLFLEIIEALFSLDGDKPEREHRQAKHRALGYVVEDG
jgi:hypothetical protein